MLGDCHPWIVEGGHCTAYICFINGKIVFVEEIEFMPSVVQLNSGWACVELMWV